MDKLKRYIPVIALALVLVLGVGQPMEVFATSSFVNMSITDLPVTVKQDGGYQVMTFHYDVESFNVRRYYYLNGVQYFYDSISSNVYLYSSTVAVSPLEFSFGPCNNYSLTNSYNFDSFGFDYHDLWSVPDLVSVKIRMSFLVTCSAARSGDMYSKSYFVKDSGYNSLYTSYLGGVDYSSTFNSSYFSSSPRRVVSEYTLTATDLNTASSYTHISPEFVLRFNNVQYGDEFTIVLESVEFDVISAPVFPAVPVLSQNWTATPQYYTSGSSASPLIVSTTFGSGEVGTVTYQWYKSTSGSSSDGVAISGATSSSYTPSTSALGTMYYYCVVTNTYEDMEETATTSQACIKVVEAPKAPQITQNLSSGIMEYTQGDAASPFVISAINSGDGTLSYQWYRNTTNSTSGGTAISGATKSSYTPSTSTIGTQYYYCVVTNSVGTLSESTTSNVGAVRVVPPPDPAQAPVINPNLSTSIRDYYIGDPAAELKIGASVTDGGTLTYQWYSNTVNSNSGGTLLPGETDRTFTPSTDTLGTMYYYCVVTNTLPDSTASSKSNVACIQVNELPKAQAPVISTDLPSDPIVYTQGDAAAAIGISARSPYGGVLTYQWYKNTVAENSGGTLIAGADGSSYEPDTSEVGTKYYYVVITNSLNDTTASVTSSVATVIVGQDQVPDLLGDIMDAIGGIAQAILDGIVSLFVPSQEDMIAYAERWDDLLSERFGAVYESTTLVADSMSILLDAGGVTTATLEVPKVTVDLAGTPWVFGGWSVDPVPDGFEFLTDVSKQASRLVASLAMFNGLRKRFISLMTGSPMIIEPPEPTEGDKRHAWLSSVGKYTRVNGKRVKK